MSLLEEKLGTDVAVRNILFATDFSEVSEAALRYATALSLRYGSEVHVAHVLPRVKFLRPGAPDPAVIGSIYEDAHSNAQEKIQTLSMRLRGYPHKTYVRHGKVAEVLADLIREQQIDMLVLGTHARTGLGKLLMGSVAEEVFRMASCPVLTVGPRVRPAGGPVPAQHACDLPPTHIDLRHIFHATDFQRDTAHACSYAVSLAREFRARLTLVHVIEDYGDVLHEHPGTIDVALRKLEELVPHPGDLRSRPEFLVRYGAPAEAILRTAQENDADLIVLGLTPGMGPLRAATHLGGSTAHKVVVGASCPVLTVRQ
jgi:nucleotide-binding universal stress UspA family protein